MSKILGFTLLFLFAGTMAFAQSPQCNKSSANCSEAAIKACAEKHGMTVEQCKAICGQSSKSSAAAGMESTPLGKLAAYEGADAGKANCAAAKTQCATKTSAVSKTQCATKTSAAAKTCQPGCKAKAESKSTSAETKSTTTAMRDQLFY